MVLDAVDRQKAVWLKLRAHLVDRLTTLRASNDGDKSPIETAKLRGRIAELKLLLSEDDEPIDVRGASGTTY